MKPLKDIQDPSSNLILSLSLLSIGHFKVQQSKTPPRQEEGHFKYTQQRHHHFDTCTKSSHLCVCLGLFLSRVCLCHVVRISACFRVTLYPWMSPFWVSRGGVSQVTSRVEGDTADTLID